jgi:hypothetical protein
MKRILALLIIGLTVSLAYSQEKFKVPNLTDAHKHHRLASQMCFVMIVGADYAKKQGDSMEAYAKHLGNLAKTSWKTEGGFDTFAKGTLYNWESLRHSTTPSMVIIKQSDDFIQFRTPSNLIKNWFKDGDLYEMSFEDVLNVLKIAHEIIADHLGVTYEQKIVDDNWIEVTIAKKG